MVKKEMLTFHATRREETGHSHEYTLNFRKTEFKQYRQRDGEDALTRSSGRTGTNWFTKIQFYELGLDNSKQILF